MLLILKQEIKILPIKKNQLFIIIFFLKKNYHTKRAKKSAQKIKIVLLFTTDASGCTNIGFVLVNGLGCGYGMISDCASSNQLALLINLETGLGSKSCHKIGLVTGSKVAY